RPDSAGDEEGLLVLNPDYAFVLRRKRGKDWALAQFSDGGGPTTNPVRAMLDGLTHYQQYPLSTPLGMSVELFTSLPDLAVQSFEALSPTRVRMRFSRRGMTLQKTRSGQTVEGELVMDPTRHWCVMEGKERFPSQPAFEARRTVAEQEGQLVCTNCTLGIPGGDEWVYQFDEIRVNDPLPARSCFLSHYGLPEPVDVFAPAASRSWWSYLTIAAVLCAVVASYAWYRSRRPPSVITDT
ncbi:MAG: hypothetical protein ACRC33_27470, partial [Gemmataceae bacterium]